MRKTGLCIVLAAGMLCACANDSVQDESMQSAETQDEEASVTGSDQSGSEDEQTDSDESNVNTNVEYTTAFEERQYGDANATVIETDSGYYYIMPAYVSEYVEVLGKETTVDTTAIQYIDKESGVMIPLCNKADCDHENPDCIAVSDGIIGESLCSDETYLYFVALEDEYSDEASELIERYENGESKDSLGVDQVTYYTNLNLYRIKRDGTVKDLLSTLDVSLNTYYFLDEDEEGVLYSQGDTDVSNMYVIDGRIYFAMCANECVSICSYDISSNKLETLYTDETDNVRTTLRLCHSGDYLWVQEEWSGSGGYEADIFCIKLSENEVKTIITDISDARGLGMMADGDRMYYSSEGEMWTCDYETGEKQVLCTYENADKTYYSPVPWQDKLVVCRMDCVEIYDREANLLCTVEFTEGDVSDGGQAFSPYIMVAGVSEDGTVYVKYNDLSIGITNGGVLYTFDINDALNGNVSFTELF